MGILVKENVQLVISHLEGCAGNFLGYLAADVTPKSYFRTDTTRNDSVLSINGRNTWHQEIDKHLRNHRVVVCHNYDVDLIKDTFPNAKIVQIYPYTHIGNVLYNICHKKLDIKIPNVVDNHLIHLNIWHPQILQQQPTHQCMNFWDLTDKFKIEQVLESPLTETQNAFFNNYWAKQIPHALHWPSQPMKIVELLEFWKIANTFDPWLVGWVIFVFEKINLLPTSSRLWSIDNANILQSWKSLRQIENLYR